MAQLQLLKSIKDSLQSQADTVYPPEKLKVYQMWHDEMVGGNGHPPGFLVGRACDEFFACLNMLSITRDAIPRLDIIKPLLAKNGWQVLEMSRGTTAEELAWCYANKLAPICVNVRTREHQHFDPLPDYLHDFFGHLVMLINEIYAECMYLYGKQAMNAKDLGCLDLCDRIFYRMETLVFEKDGVFTLVGPATLTSLAEAKKALDPHTKKNFFSLRKIMELSVDDSVVQDEYHYLCGLAHLLELLDKSWSKLFALVRPAKAHAA